MANTEHQPLPVPADPFLGLEPSFGPVITLQDRVSALESIIGNLLKRISELEATIKVHDSVIDTLNGPWGSKIEQRISDLEGSQSVSRLEADCAGVNGSIF